MIAGFSAPNTLEIVELAHLRSEQVNNNITGINQHPISVWQTFDARSAGANLFKLPQNMVSQRTDVTRRPTRRNDHLVSNGRLPIQIYNDKLFGFVVFEGLGNDTGERLNIFERCRSLSGVRPRSESRQG